MIDSPSVIFGSDLGRAALFAERPCASCAVSVADQLLSTFIYGVAVLGKQRETGYGHASRKYI